jgi:hypothetical protein
MSGSGIPIVDPIFSAISGGQTKEEKLAREQMDRQQQSMDRLNQERLDYERQQQKEKMNSAMKARRRQKQESTAGTSRADTIMTSPLGEVASAAPTAKKSILGG